MSARHSRATAGEIEVRRDKPANPQPRKGRTPMMNTAQASLPAFGSRCGLLSKRGNTTMRMIHGAGGRMIKRVTEYAVILPLVIIEVFGALVARAGTEQREVSGEVSIELCQKEGGSRKVIDRAKATATFRASVAEIAGSKEARTDFTWNGTSEKGVS